MIEPIEPNVEGTHMNVEILSSYLPSNDSSHQGQWVHDPLFEDIFTKTLNGLEHDTNSFYPKEELRFVEVMDEETE
ncbi:hypothetical protein VNO77_50254 [Canavalia gladiata]|uniref:Uncharacterized protein n=1 Tax=Canavalia gladiata TaxID=3824 RepID=A0AAN9JDG3_CANGL